MEYLIFVTLILGTIVGVVAWAIIDGIRKSDKQSLFVIIPSMAFGYYVAYTIAFWSLTTILMYKYTDNNTATTGQIFKDTIVLSEHKLIGSSDYVIFKTDKYSRSDRQSEVIEVVVNKNKKQ